MIKKYPWHFFFFIFVILCLANIFQKMQWNAPTDHIEWSVENNLIVCKIAPDDSLVKKGDILASVNKFPIKSLIDLNRVIRKEKVPRYVIERDGLYKTIIVDISLQYTSLSYYILAFSGILMLMLALRILNIVLKKKKGFSPPSIFYLLALTFSGFLIFSPTGNYHLSDFTFLILDRISFLFFPALLLHYAIYFPIKSRILRKISHKFLRVSIYMPPLAILTLNVYFLLDSMSHINTENLMLAINHFRNLSLKYSGIYIIIALVFFLVSNLSLIIRKKQKRFILPLSGIFVSIVSMLIFNLNPKVHYDIALFLMVFLPFGVTYLLGHRKFTDIENVIKKTIAISLFFPFIFGIYFVLGSNVEQNKLLGIFWSFTAIVTAGLLYKPIEATAHTYFEKLFFKGTYTFKRKLKELIQSLPTERDLYSLSTSFLNTINNGFQLQKSTFLIHHRKNIFYSLPRKNKILLSRNFRNDLFKKSNLIFSAVEFERKYPKDYKVMKDLNYYQFLPLKTPEKLIGLVAFGPKTDNTYLSLEDWELLFNIASPLGLSVENASLYSELKTQFDEINLLKEFNENIIDNINLGIVVLSGLNIIKTWNTIMEQKFKVSAEEAINKKAYKILGSEVWKSIYKNKKGISNLDNVKIEINNTELIFDIYISPLRDSMAKRIGTILVFEDVTEKIFIRNQLVTSEKMASLGLLSAGIAHEVNTPLTGISSYCQLILDAPEDPENIEMISRIQEQVIRANKIIRTLLDFSRQKGESPVDVDLGRVINESISLIEHKLKQKDIEIKKEYNFTGDVYGFSTRLQQLFINLLMNATDACPASGGIISILGETTETQLTVRIKDNGVGIEAKQLDKIFDPFFTTKDQGKGTGLGLSIVYTIVEEHYGEITANSKPGKGTTFHIRFPLNSPLRRIKL
ncbi:MAG: GHKL domain-containing protein [bacterium]|nr:GHKL domain-containing protein [bacterium]